MTPEQLKRFHEVGCLSRCLIKMSEIFGSTITKDQFCARFETFFPSPKTNYGQLDGTAFVTILQQLPLPKNMGAHGDYSVIDHHFNVEKRQVFVISHVNLNPGCTDAIHHCSVLTKIGGAGFSLWTPSKDGSDVPLDLSKADWIDKQCSGLVLF